MTAKGRILIVDDIATNVDILRRILRKDYDLDTAASGEECLAKLPAFKPQLVLLDIMMPGIDGYETCRRIKSSDLGQFIQVILVSGKGSAAERLQGYEAQADDYIVKPFNHEELLSKVRVHFRLGDTQRQLSAAKEQLQIYANDLEKLVEQRHPPVGGHAGHDGLRPGPADRLARHGNRRARAPHALLRANPGRGTEPARAVHGPHRRALSARPLSRQSPARHRQGCRPRRDLAKAGAARLRRNSRS